MNESGMTPDPRLAGADDARSLCILLRRQPSLTAKLEAIAETERARPALGAAIDALLQRSTAKEFMFDDVLKLLKVWFHHRQGDTGERDYWLCAFRLASQRDEIRKWLGIARRDRIEKLVMLITVDCMRGDHLSCNGYPQPTTPAIDVLASAGVNFPAAYSTAGQTAQSFPGILLSNYFQNYGRSRTVPEHLTTLAEALSEHGFYNVAFGAANPHISHFYGYDRGFDEFTDYLGSENFDYTDDTFVDNSPRRLTPPTEQELMAISEDCRTHPDVYEILRELTGLEGLPLVREIASRARFYPYAAADLVKGAMSSIADPALGARRFYWLHLMDLHENITVPFSRLGSFSTIQKFLLNTLLASPLGVDMLGAYADKYRQLYDSAISYVDMNVEVLANFLTDSGLMERTLLCLTADHGQELLERGVFGHGYDRLVEGLVHVPLVLGGGLAARVDASAASRPVSTLDISPTILDVCDVSPVPDTFLGTTLNDTEPRPLYGQTFYDGADNRCSDRQQRAFELKPFPEPVRESCKEIVYCIDGGYQLIYDRGRDTSELQRITRASVPADPVPDAEEMKAQTEEYFRSIYAPPEEAYAVELSGKDREVVAMRLQDLGYI